MPQLNSSPLLRYGLAVLCIALATLLTSLRTPLYTRTPFALFFVAVLLATLFSGRGAGLLAIVLSVIASAYLIIAPYYSFNIGLRGALMVSVFVLVSLIISSLTERLRRAETTARLSRDQLSTTLMSIGDAMIATDIEGRGTLMNPVAQALTGWSVEEARGKKLAEVFRIMNRQTRRPAENPVTKALSEGGVSTLADDTLLLAKDGREIPIDDSGAAIKDASGRTTGGVLVFRDLSEQKLSDARLRFQAHLLDIVEQAMIATDTSGRITYWNRYAEKLYGWKAEEVVGQSISDITPSESTREQAQEIMEHMLSGKRWSGEFLVRHRDGTNFPVRVTNLPIYDESGQQVGVVGSSEDISERKRAEETRSLLAEIVESTGDAIIGKTLDGIITSWNRGAEQMYGYRAEEVLGLPISLIVPPDRADELADILRRLREGERVAELETVRLHKDGRRIDVAVTISPIRNVKGVVSGASTIARDITERKQSEERQAELLAREQSARQQAELANRTKDEFLATLSHELRPPLTVMLGWTWMLRAKDLAPETYNHALETSERNVRAQAQLIDDLLDVSRIITGKLKLEVEPTELIPVIEAAIDTARPAAAAKGIRIETELDGSASTALCDPARMQQVVWNLLSNAVKFTPRDGRIWVRLKRSGAHIELSVTDTGPGIRPEFLPYVFDRFRQADSSTTRTHGGLGLGLAIVRHLMELHGGTVRVMSHGEGEGATFTVSLSVTAEVGEIAGGEAAGAREKQRALPECAAALDSLSVLVVDEEDARDLLITALEQCGAKMTAVESARAALETLSRSAQDVLVSDLGMPEEDGYALIRKVREMEERRGGGHLPPIAVTAYASEGARREALAAGYELHLAKPIEPSRLIESITGLIEKR